MLPISIVCFHPSYGQGFPAHSERSVPTLALFLRRAVRFAQGVTGFCVQVKGCAEVWGNHGFYVSGWNSRGLYEKADRGLPSPNTRATKGTQIKFWIFETNSKIFYYLLNFFLCYSFLSFSVLLLNKWLCNIFAKGFWRVAWITV